MEEIRDIFQSVGAILEGHFQLTSGRHSNTYIQCARVLENPVVTEKLVSMWVKKLNQMEKLACDVVVGPAVGGIILSYELGRQLKKRAIFAEREAGKLTLRRLFAIEPGDRVIVVEDVVTTGGSVLETMDLVKSKGGEITAVCSLVDRGSNFNPGVLYLPLLKIEVASFPKEECPLCQKGIAIEMPGSRRLKEQP